MKKTIGLSSLLLLLLFMTSCSKEETFEPLFTTDLETETVAFLTEGGVYSFELESNESWSVNELPDWIQMKVEDNGPVIRSTTYADGRKIVTMTIAPNTHHLGHKKHQACFQDQCSKWQWRSSLL
ncbi:MAG: hypothetical protein WCZ46_03295 [Proteiniphilum sp.]|jgi:hypothetical protein